MTPAGSRQQLPSAKRIRKTAAVNILSLSQFAFVGLLKDGAGAPCCVAARPVRSWHLGMMNPTQPSASNPYHRECRDPPVVTPRDKPPKRFEAGSVPREGIVAVALSPPGIPVHDDLQRQIDISNAYSEDACVSVQQ